MNRVQLGKSDLYVSQLGLGCINFGTTVEKSKAFSIMDEYVNLGGNLFDTANNYAIWNENSRGRDSETVIGEWIENNPSKREQIVLCTKLGALRTVGSTGFGNPQGNGKQVIQSEIKKSLKTLKTDYIDLLYLHIDDFNTPQEETMEALADLVKKGYVRQIGCSNFMTYRIERARRICKEHSYPFFCAVQQRNSYFKPAMDADFGVQEYASRELFHYLDECEDLSLIYHTSLLYGTYLKDKIEMEEYDTAFNRKRLSIIKNQSENPISFVLKEMLKERPKDVILCTTKDERHLIQNVKAFEG